MMNHTQQIFLELLEDNNLNTTDFTPTQLSSLYIYSALLGTVTVFLKEELWLKDKEDEKRGLVTSYEDFIGLLIKDELASLSFLKDFLIKKGSTKIKEISKVTQRVEAKVLASIVKRPSYDQKTFLISTLKEISKYFLQEEKDQGGRLQSLGHFGLRLYRAFDNLDEVFGFNYQLDSNMIVDHSSPERLYQNAGIGVQSGYSTILLALSNIELRQGAKVIDLGSGYGRVGLVCSLLRSDIDFTGFEYVPHRVEVGNKACDFLDLEKTLNFVVQDLSFDSFKIPVADVYYLYDPFTKETYEHVLKQIVEISKQQKVIIITKGNARGWLMDISNENQWIEPVLLDAGNLCIFQSA